MPLYAGLESQATGATLRMIARTAREGIDLIPEVRVRLFVSQARAQIAHAAIENGSDYLFFLGEDIVPEEDTLLKLLSHDLDIVSGLYYVRHGFTLPMVYDFDEKRRRYVFTVKDLSKPLVEVDACGMDCMLIRTSILKEFDLGRLWEWHGYMGDDMTFCTQVRRKGHKIYLDTTCKVGHIQQEKRILPEDGKGFTLYDLRRKGRWLRTRT
ncbi:MAG: hypothetical protein DRO36_06905 [Candidatus Hecatellales archaeon]|nr:MAG: hypothetical protein DRO36_06905 [Candidatus Hecatellales archaeon]